jgi:Regulator of ribonuclease activity B
MGNRNPDTMSMKRAKIGDICEIRTPNGLGYVQCTHETAGMGQLVRILPGLFEARPADFVSLSRQKELYFIFYTLNYALRAGQAEIVSHQPVPEWARPYPLMRWPGARDESGKVLAWKIFKASDPLTLETHRHSPVIRSLTAEQEKLSVHELWSHPVIVEELARGWTPERAEELRVKDVAAAERRKLSEGTKEMPEGERLRHYMYFPDKAAAEKAGQWFRVQKFSVEVRPGADGVSWLALVEQVPPENIDEVDKIRAEMEALTKKLGGQYDGWEIAVEPTQPGLADLLNNGGKGGAS